MINKKIGIVVNSNNFSGIAKLSAMMANDISNQNIHVNIYLPILPYYTFYFKIFKKPFFWIRKIAPEYLKKYLIKRKFTFEHMLNKKNIDLKLIKIKFFLITVPKNELSKLDCIILNGIGDVIEYQKYNIKKKIYLINQIEEINSGNEKIFKQTRKLFDGDLITHCNFMKKKLSDHVKNVRIVPNPISSGIWKFKDKIDFKKERSEILIYWKNNKIYEDVRKILKEIFKLNNKIKITIFARSGFENLRSRELSNEFNTKLFFDLNENSVAELYLNHSFLLYPNKYEDFGMPPVEALACACIPILNGNTGAADMYAENNFNSIHLTYDSKLDAKNIISKLSDREELYKLRKNSLKNLDQFNPDNYGIKILDYKLIN
jgi:glycosyltransferase involved in cell wall biosynthesis